MATRPMTYQNRIIQSCIQTHLRRKGIGLADKERLAEMIRTNINRLNKGDNIALKIDSLGFIESVRKIDGFDCLHDVDEAAIIISYDELERFFYDQQTVSVEL